MNNHPNDDNDLNCGAFFVAFMVCGMIAYWLIHVCL